MTNGRHERHIVKDARASDYPCSRYFTNFGPCEEPSTIVYRIGDHDEQYGACDAHAARLLEVECDGRCVTPEDLGVMGSGVEIAYPDPECSLHGTEVGR